MKLTSYERNLKFNENVEVLGLVDNQRTTSAIAGTLPLSELVLHGNKNLGFQGKTCCKRTHHMNDQSIKV